MIEKKGKMTKNEMALAFIVLGVALRLALADYPNIEPVLAIALIAGVALGGIYSLIVPLAIMGISDWAIYAIGKEGYFGFGFVIGISIFTWTGMMLAGWVGNYMRPTFLFRMKSVAVFTGTGIIMTLLFDAWTMLGWYLLADISLESLVAGQITFTIRHLFSTLIFVPLLTTLYIYLHEYDLPSLLGWLRKRDVPEEEE